MTFRNLRRLCTAAIAYIAMAATLSLAHGATPDPYLAYTDASSGPVSGGEGNQGSYLSIFGTNLGRPAGLGTTTKVYIGGVEVANYRYLGASKAAKLGLQVA